MKASLLLPALAVVEMGAGQAEATESRENAVASGSRAESAGATSNPLQPRESSFSGPPAPCAEPETQRAEFFRVQSVRSSLDFGEAHAYGLGYTVSWWWDRSAFHPQTWTVGVGGDTQLTGRDFPDVDAWRALSVFEAARDSVAGMSVEAGVGPGRSFDAGPLRWSAQIGIKIGFYNFEYGYSYSFPIDGDERPLWLPSHAFAVRLRIPLLKTHLRYLEP